MDNNNQQTVFINNAQQPFAQQPQMNQPYGQPQMNQPYGQPQMNQPYGQPQMNQPYGQPQMNQPYGQPQYGYQQPKQPSKVMENIKDVQKQFKNKVSKMGLSTFCLIGIIAAMLLIFSPFLNFASVSYNEKVKMDKKTSFKVSVSDGLNLFELSRVSNSIDNVFDEMDDDIEKSDVIEELEDFLDDYDIDDICDMAEEKSGGMVKLKPGIVKPGIGMFFLTLKGTLVLILTPWLIILSGLGLLIFTVINNKNLKLACSIVPLVCLVLLFICSKYFFSMMGMGAWVMVLGSAGGIVSALKDN